MTSSPRAEERRALSALLLLADGRFPAGGHAHSGGLEAAAALEGVRDIAGLAAFLRGRAATAGAVAAAFAAAACAAATDAAVLGRLDREFEARLPSPVLRAVSRRLGRQLLRAGRVIWPSPGLDELAAGLPRGPHQPVVLGAVAAAADLDAHAAAMAAVYDAVAGPATAAVRLLGLDPFAVQAALAGLGPELDALAAVGASHAHTAPEDLPAWGTPLLDLLAERHATWEVRLFAS